MCGVLHRATRGGDTRLRVATPGLSSCVQPAQQLEYKQSATPRKCARMKGANITEGGRPVKAVKLLVQLTKHPVLSCHTASMPRSAFTIQIHDTESQHRRLPGRCLAGTPGFLIVTVMQYCLCCVAFTSTITVTHTPSPRQARVRDCHSS